MKIRDIGRRYQCGVCEPLGNVARESLPLARNPCSETLPNFRALQVACLLASKDRCAAANAPPRDSCFQLLRERAVSDREGITGEQQFGDGSRVSSREQRQPDIRKQLGVAREPSNSIVGRCERHNALEGKRSMTQTKAEHTKKIGRYAHRTAGIGA
ncbi:MAG TPA: hypothetical protein VK251_05870, partial [Steroidobacteraceae bacterium]|nr:hypothetical protein [Steroidobacteraceae bacterium]